MSFDYDEDFWRVFHEGLDEALATLTPKQVAKLEAGGQALAEQISGEAIPRVLDGLATSLVERLRADAPGMLRYRSESRSAFEQKVATHWGKAFDLSEKVMELAFDAGKFFYDKHVPADGVHDYVFEALGRLQARALRIAEEVLLLLKAGYGQAGFSRWRTLYEVSVVADFIADSGDDCAERYFAHEGVETWKGMKEFQQHAETLGQERYPKAEEDATKAHYEQLLAHYGPGFGGSYGWAQAELRRRDPALRDRATFEMIEAGTDTSHVRPYYRTASHGVHANPKGVTWDADGLPSTRGSVLLTGPSPAGLADPGQVTCLALTRITCCFLNSKPGPAASYILAALSKLADEASAAYVAAHQRLEADDAAPSA